MLRSREQKVSDGRIRLLRVPQLNVDASSYIDLIEWTDRIVSEPSFTAFATSNDVRKMIKSNTLSKIKTSDLPCHIQSVERHIKMVSEALSLVCDHARREGLIRNKLASKATMPCFDTKSQYSIRTFTKHKVWRLCWSKMGRDTGHLRVVSPGIFYEQLCIQKLFMKPTQRTEYFCCKRNFAIISCNILFYCYLQ